MKTAEEVLSEIAGNNPDYLNFDICIKAMKQYANQKLDEAAEKAIVKTEKRLVKNHVLNSLNPTGIRMDFTVVDKQSILQLKDL